MPSVGSQAGRCAEMWVVFATCHGPLNYSVVTWRWQSELLTCSIGEGSPGMRSTVGIDWLDLSIEIKRKAGRYRRDLCLLFLRYLLAEMLKMLQPSLSLLHSSAVNVCVFPHNRYFSGCGCNYTAAA